MARSRTKRTGAKTLPGKSPKKALRYKASRKPRSTNNGGEKKKRRFKAGSKLLMQRLI